MVGTKSEGSGALTGGRDEGARAHRRPNDGRRIIATAFDLLDQVGALQPVRLIDLAEATGIPEPTVHRLLKQLIEVGAVRREVTRYRLGACLLGLGARVTPEHRLRVIARRPMAELAAATGAAVGLTADIGGEVVFLDIVEACVPLGGLPEPGCRARPGTAQARAHSVIGRPTPIVDEAAVVAGLRCVAVAVPLGNGQLAAVSTLIAGERPSVRLIAATAATGARIARQLHVPSTRGATILGENSTQWRMGRP
jgi:DNA-binding IclR family transcriptional regulator